MTGRPVLPVPVAGADGLGMLDALRTALSGAGPALAPHPVGSRPDPAAWAPLRADEDADDDPVAAVVSTTGSTGRAKHVLLPAAALLASAAATHDALGGAGTWLLPVPAHTVAGVQVLVRSLVAGTRPAVLDLAGGFDPVRFAAAAEGLAVRARGRRYTSLVPAQLDLLLEAGGSAPEVLDALAGFDAVLVGGAALPEALRRRAAEAGVRAVATYGMTETCGGCVYDGVPLPGVRVQVVPLPGTGPDAADDDDGAGRVLLGGPVVARGYRGPAATGGAPGDGLLGGAGPDGAPGEGFAVEAGVRWFRTADRGRLEDGVLRLAGRTDDVVVSGGTNVALDAVDRVVRSVAGVRDCLVVGVPSARWGTVVGALLVDGPGPADDDAVRAAVRGALGAAAVPRLLDHVDRLPLTGVGKPDRATAVARLLPAGAGTSGLRDHGVPSPTEETT